MRRGESGVHGFYNSICENKFGLTHIIGQEEGSLTSMKSKGGHLYHKTRTVPGYALRGQKRVVLE